LELFFNLECDLSGLEFFRGVSNVVVFEGMKGAMDFFPVENQIVLPAMVRFILQRKNPVLQNFFF